jgi:hypothetical protein
MVIVPDSLSEMIDAKLDAAFVHCPDAAKDREYLFARLLQYFDEHGIVPNFKLRKNPTWREKRHYRRFNSRPRTPSR